MKPYPKYKLSNIQWLGDIPEHWEVKKLKYIVNGKLEYGANESAELEDRSLPRYIRITDFGNDGKLKEDTFKSLSEEVALGYLLQEGDILFARSGATVGKTFQFKNYQGVACYAGYLIKASPNSNLALSDFVYYFTKSDIYENWKNSIFVQATIQNIGADKYNQLELPIPPLPEQTAIAQFLDEKTAQIDTLIAQKQRLITLLKEERMAFINEQFANEDKKWDIRKVSRSFNLIGSGTTPEAGNPQYYQNGEINWINTGDLNDGLLEFCNKKITKLAFDSFSSLKIYPKGTLLIAMYGATIGKTSILGIDGCTNQACCALADSPFFDIKFVFYWFLGNKQAIINLSYGGGQPNISQEVIRTLKIPCPPLKTQQKIVESIETTTGKIDATLVKIVQEIELLKEYRMALISEVVTGKISVV